MILRPSFCGFRGRGLLPVNTVLPIGDSITGQNFNYAGTGPNYRFLAGFGYAVHARQMASSNWNHSEVSCATGGARASEVYANHLASALASDAQLIIDAPGTNDAVQGINPLTVAQTRRDAWAQMRAAGKYVAAIATCPLPNTHLSSAPGFYPARVVALNAACKAAADADGVLWIDTSTPLETVPGSGSGIADPACFDNASFIHPNDLGAFRMGKAIAAALATRFRFTVDPLTMTGFGAPFTMLTPNGNMAAGTTRPTNWNAPLVPAGAGAAVSESMITGDLGLRWYRLALTKGASTGTFSVTNWQGNIGGSPANKVVDGICYVKVESGTIGNLLCTWYSNPGVSQIAFDGAISNGPTISAADGIRVFRTQKFTVASDRSLVWPELTFAPVGGDAVILIANNMLRQYA